MDDSAMSRLRKNVQELLGSSYYVTKTKSRDDKTGQQPWQQHHGKAKDVMRHKSARRNFHLHSGALPK